MVQACTGTVAENLRFFIDCGFALLVRVAPAFAGLLAQPKVLSRFHAMVGGDAAFGAAVAGKAGGETTAETAGETENPEGPRGHGTGSGPEPRGLPDSLKAYLRAEQHLGRIDAAADIDATATLIISAIHGEILPRVLFTAPDSPITIPPDLAGRLAQTVLSGIEPGRRHP
jgi:hypothetical protein